MSWKRHMKLGKARISTPSSSPTYASGYSTNFASYLPDVYTGFSNRVDRYRMYDQMDQDPEIKTALDILADFTTQNSEDYDIPIKIKYKDTNMGENIVTTLEDRLDAWAVLNDFKVRMYEIVRNTFKYGDQFFIRDPETCELYYVHPMNVDKIVVNEKLGKKPIIYYIRDVSLNIRDKVFTNVQQAMDTAAYPGTLPNSLSGSGSQYGTLSGGGGTSGGNNSTPFGTGGQMDIIPVDAEHVIHISLNTGLDAFWPFGTSILESIFKTYKQKELLEDSIIIYRVQRAPERRVFKIDVGDMPATQAMAAVERLKNEIHQRRIPSNKGGTTSLMDAAYNPMSILEDYFFPQTSDGRGSSVETLPGGENLGQIDDLRYFNNKLIRGLGIPSSYLPFGPEDGNTMFSDGGTARALIQEHRFNKQCQRWQNIIVKTLDTEFKRYIIFGGYGIDTTSFEVTFKPPMNFASYRKTELDASLINTYMPLNSLSYVSKQFILKKMGWTQDEIIENEKYWLQENPNKMTSAKAEPDDGASLQSVGIPSPDDPSSEIDDTEQVDVTDENTQSTTFDPNSVGDTF